MTEPDKEYTVSLGFSYEDAKIEESPLSKAETVPSNDIYAIQVKSTPIEGGSSNYYAYGLFSNKSNMQIKLLAGYKYNFECTFIVNAKNVVYFTGMDFSYPFDVVNSRATLTDSFTYSSNMHFFNLRSSGIKLQVMNMLIIQKLKDIMAHIMDTSLPRTSL